MDKVECLKAIDKVRADVEARLREAAAEHVTLVAGGDHLAAMVPYEQALLFALRLQEIRAVRSAIEAVVYDRDASRLLCLGLEVPAFHAHAFTYGIAQHMDREFLAIRRAFRDDSRTFASAIHAYFELPACQRAALVEAFAPTRTHAGFPCDHTDPVYVEDSGEEIVCTACHTVFTRAEEAKAAKLASRAPRRALSALATLAGRPFPGNATVSPQERLTERIPLPRIVLPLPGPDFGF